MENIDVFYKLIESGLTGPTHVSSDKSEYAGFTGMTGLVNNTNKSDGKTGPTGPSSPKVNNNNAYDECSHKHFLYQ